MSKVELQEYVSEKYEKIGNLIVERVAAYIRVSTTEQKLHGLSLDAQKMKLQEYAEKNNLKIVEWYMDEGVSARKVIKKRPELQRMISDTKKKKFDRIIFIKLDRYFRSVAEYHECQKILDANNVTWSATEEKYDLTTANGRAFVNMKLTIAELEADQTGERIVLVNDYKIKSGLPLYGEQCLPFCYTLEQVGEHKRVVKHPEFAEIFEDMLQYYEKYRSIRSTITYMKENYDFVISYNSIKNTLKNEMLYGMYKGNPKYVLEPFITKEHFDRLQVMVKGNKKEGIQKEYIFSGMLLCPYCGRKLAGASRTDRRTEGNVRIYKYYRCQKANMDKNCDFKMIVSENRIERSLIKNIEQYLNDEKVEASRIAKKNKKISQKNSLDELQEELDRLNYQFRKGFLKNVSEYEKECEILTAKIEKAQQKHHQESEIDFSRIEGILSSDWKSIYEELDEVHRRAFWKSFIHSVEINDKKNIGKVNFF